MAGTGAAAAVAASELKSCPNALLVVQGGLPRDGGGGLDTMLWGRQVDPSSIISRDMGHLTGMATATASAKDISTPGAVHNGDRAPSSLLVGGAGRLCTCCTGKASVSAAAVAIRGWRPLGPPC
jgi:hypothetical protein